MIDLTIRSDEGHVVVLSDCGDGSAELTIETGIHQRTSVTVSTCELRNLAHVANAIADLSEGE